MSHMTTMTATNPPYIITPYLTAMCEGKQEYAWKLGPKTLTQTPKFNHLGIEWTAGKTAPDISKHIQSTRRMAYKFMGPQSPWMQWTRHTTGTKLIETYVLPLLTPDAAVLTNVSITELTQYHKKPLRQIQGLPVRTADPAVHLFSGTLPLLATIHPKVRSPFGMITWLGEQHMLYQLVPVCSKL